jgi:hypothetical protein
MGDGRWEMGEGRLQKAERPRIDLIPGAHSILPSPISHLPSPICVSYANSITASA